MKVYVHLRANGASQVLYTLKYELPTPDATFVDLEKFIHAELDKVNVSPGPRYPHA